METTRVVILTANHRIEGEISVGAGARITDYLVASKSFIGVTDAVVCDLDGHVRFRTSFLNVGRDQVHLLAAVEFLK